MDLVIGCPRHGGDGIDASNGRGAKLRRVLWIVLLVNAVMFGVEVGFGLLSGSVALHADALDFFGDATAYILTLVVLDRSIRWRAGAALAKALTMAVFGCFVLAEGVRSALSSGTPDATTMGAVGLAALVANVGCATLLFAHRGRDVNLRSVWLCSRNDALNNIAVVLAGVGVFGTATRWPDIGVAAVIAGLNFAAAWSIFRQAMRELYANQPPPPATKSSSKGRTGKTGIA